MTTKTLKAIKKELSNFSDDDLTKELERRRKIKRGKVLGYRVIFHGNEYEYGDYSNYLINPKMTKEEAKNGAEKALNKYRELGRSGRIETIYKHNLEHKRVIH